MARRGNGRPRKLPAERQSIPVLSRFHLDDLEAMEELCARLNTTRSEVIRIAIRHLLRTMRLRHQ